MEMSFGKDPQEGEETREEQRRAHRGRGVVFPAATIQAAVSRGAIWMRVENTS